MHRAVSLAAVALMAGGAGCAHQQGAHAASPPAAVAAAPPRAAPPAGPRLVCPTRLPGSQVSVEDVPDGVAIGLTAPPERVDVVRAIAHVIAARYNHRDEVAAEDREPDDGTGGGGSGGGGSGSGEPDRAPPASQPGGTHREAIPSSRAIAQDMQAGARLLFLAKDPSQATALRRDVRAHVKRMRAGACWTKPPSG
ncbi:MAG TPA: hypothetical protein VGQ83_37400 [Polyangia bacterium]|jgi:hypothetical protein